MGGIKYLRPTELFTELNKKPVYGKKIIAIAVFLVLAVFARLTPQTEAQRKALTASSVVIALFSELLIYFAFIIIAVFIYYFIIAALFKTKVDINRLFAVYITSSIAGAMGRFANATFSSSLGIGAVSSPYLSMFYNVFDVFVIWKLVYLVIGLNLVLGIDKRRAKGLVTLMWLLLVAVSMIAAPFVSGLGIIV